jgi:peptidoglycan/xylan/chitin deacetylase (PgdA/CDA1 family)
MKFKATLFSSLVFLALGCLFIKDSEDLKLFVWFISTFFLFVVSLGVIVLRINFFLPALCRLKGNKVLITFDDGPHPENTPKILDSLKENDVRAVFFIVGEKAEKHPEIVQRILDEGHLIGNHTFSHPPLFALMSGNRVSKEIDKCQTLLNNKFTMNNLFFRPPIGYTNPIIARSVRALNVRVMGWTFRSWDTVLKNPEALLKRSRKGLKPGNILLFHDTLDQTSSMLPSLLKISKEKGINFVDVHMLNHDTNV